MKKPPVSQNKPNNAPKTLAQFYEFYRQFFLTKPNKEFTKDEQAELVATIDKPPKIIRGQEVHNSLIRNFLQVVAEKAEYEYDKLQTKSASKA